MTVLKLPVDEGGLENSKEFRRAACQVAILRRTANVVPSGRWNLISLYPSGTTTTSAVDSLPTILWRTRETIVEFWSLKERQETSAQQERTERNDQHNRPEDDTAARPGNSTALIHHVPSVELDIVTTRDESREKEIEL